MKRCWLMAAAVVNAAALAIAQDSKGSLSEIKEEHFPRPSSMPALPESKDGARIDVPPADQPTGDALPRGN